MTGPNRSTAVMQRRSEPTDSLDDFPTPPWATRALCGRLQAMGSPLAQMSVREPTANRGHMARPLSEFFGEVVASDVHDYGAGYPVCDYLTDAGSVCDWSIFNPPFRLAEQFILQALDHSRMGVAAIVRTSFLEGVGRHERLFSVRPPSDVLQFCERVVMHKGRLSPKGSTATSYCWLVWRASQNHALPRFRWIAPCRKRFERPEDYRTNADPSPAPLLDGIGGDA